MVQDGFRNIIVSLMLIGLFAVLITTAIQGMGVNYGVSSERMGEATGGALNTSDYSEELETVDTTTSNFRARFEGGDVDDVDDASGLFSVIGDIVGVITTPITLLAQVGENLLGFPTILTHAISGIIGLLILLGMWRVLRAGD